MQRFKNILCVVNPLKNASSALRRASELAARQGARLTFIDVARDPSSALGDSEHLSASVGRELLAGRETDIQSLLEKNGIAAKAEIKVLVGIPFIEIIQQVLRGKHDLVIKPTESPGRRFALLGTTDKHLLRKCPCPVWLVKPTRRKKYERILAAVDSDPGQPSTTLNTLLPRGSKLICTSYLLGKCLAKALCIRELGDQSLIFCLKASVSPMRSG